MIIHVSYVKIVSYGSPQPEPTIHTYPSTQKHVRSQSRLLGYFRMVESPSRLTPLLVQYGGFCTVVFRGRFKESARFRGRR